MKVAPHGLVTALFALLTILFCTKSSLMLTDTDFWWHLAAGDLIRDTSGIPFSDPFSFTANNYEWLNISWLWDLIYSWLNSLSPLYLPVVATAIINALTLALLCNLLLRKGASVPIALLVMLLAIIPYSYMLTPRPHEMTFLFTIIFYSICDSKNKKLLPILPPLIILWVNMHGGFFVAFIILAAYLFESLLKKEKRSLALFLTLITCFVATFLNPLGVEIYQACLRTFSSTLLPIISEWAPLALNKKHALHIAYLILFLITFRPLNKQVNLAEKLLSLLWAFEAYEHERNLPIFVLFSAPVLAMNLQSLLARTKLNNFILKKNAEYEKDLTNPKTKTASLIFSCVLVILLFSTLPRQFLNLNVPTTNPIEEAEFVKRNYPDRFFLNDYFQGGYLLYIWHSEPRVFIDGRAETAYPFEISADYLQFHNAAGNWPKLLNKYGISGVILPNDNPLLLYFVSNPAWRKVLTGKVDTVYIKQQK